MVLSAKTSAEIRRLWLAGEKVDAIARQLNVGRGTVWKHTRDFPPRVVRVSVDDEETFKRMWAEGATTKKIAEHFGCSPSTVSVTAKRLGLPGRLAFREGRY